MELGAYEMLLNAVERDSLRSSLSFAGGVIEVMRLERDASVHVLHQ